VNDGRLELVRHHLADANASADTDALIEALGAIRDHLHGNGFSSADTESLLALMGALLDHRRGKRNPLLAVTGNARNASFVLDGQFKAAAAFALELMRHCPGETKETAASRIAARFKQEGIKATATKVKTWHHEISNDRAPADVIESYKMYLNRAGEPDEIKAQAALETLVKGPRPIKL
jgi:hypothetical protein